MNDLVNVTAGKRFFRQGIDVETVNITAYTDSGCFPNPGHGGCAVIFILEKDGIRYIKTIRSYTPPLVEVSGKQLFLLKMGKKRKPIEQDGKFYIETTNNRMEIGAVIEAFERVKDPSNCNLTIYADSLWAINMANDTWVAKENIDLVRYARELVKKFKSVKFVHVKGHTGDRFNEWCDKLAMSAYKDKLKEKEVLYYNENIDARKE